MLPARPKITKQNKPKPLNPEPGPLVQQLSPNWIIVDHAQLPEEERNQPHTKKVGPEGAKAGTEGDHEDGGKQEVLPVQPRV